MLDKEKFLDKDPERSGLPLVCNFCNNKAYFYASNIGQTKDGKFLVICLNCSLNPDKQAEYREYVPFG